MAKLIYATPTSLDGYIADENYDWSAPDEDGLVFISEVMRPIGAYLYGRKMYETMAIGQRRTLFLAGRRPRWTSRGSGRRPARSSIPNRSRPSLHRRRALSGNSTRGRFAT